MSILQKTIKSAAYHTGWLLGRGRHGLEGIGEFTSKLSEVFQQSIMLYGFIQLSIHLLRNGSPADQPLLVDAVAARFRTFLPPTIADQLAALVCQIQHNVKEGNMSNLLSFLDKRMAEDKKDDMIKLLIVLTKEDQVVQSHDYDLLQSIAQQVGVDQGQFESLFASMAPSASVVDREEFYQLLGLDPTASQEALRRAYRNMSAHYHPDRYQQKSDHEQQEAHKQFLAVGKAYKQLC